MLEINQIDEPKNFKVYKNKHSQTIINLIESSNFDQWYEVDGIESKLDFDDIIAYFRNLRYRKVYNFEMDIKGSRRNKSISFKKYIKA